jgi:ELWxxDGT repeat protein
MVLREFSPASLYWEYVLPVGPILFFSANDGIHGQELWRSDGTPDGTLLVRDLAPGGSGSNPSDYTMMNGILYFLADDGTTGRELWRSDGTEAGTSLVADIDPGPGDGVIFLTTAGDWLYLSAGDGVDGLALWKSDGTESGTGLVEDQWPSASFRPRFLGSAAATVYFFPQWGPRALWASDGSEEGTRLVREFAPSPYTGFGFAATLGSVLYFQANDNVTGPELWRSDGSEAGTLLVKDIAPGAPAGLSGYFHGEDLLAAAGALVFGADPSGWGRLEPWTSDGTSEGTHPLADIVPGLLGSTSQFFTRAGPLVFFIATDRWGDRELWATPASPRRAVLAIEGVALGGSATAWVLGSSVSIATEPGQSALEIAQVLAQAIRTHATLAAQGIVAYGSEDGVVLGGALPAEVAIATSDPGLLVSPEPVEPVDVPTAGAFARAILAVALVGVGGALLRRRR